MGITEMKTKMKMEIRQDIMFYGDNDQKAGKLVNDKILPQVVTKIAQTKQTQKTTDNFKTKYYH